MFLKLQKITASAGTCIHTGRHTGLEHVGIALYCRKPVLLKGKPGINMAVHVNQPRCQEIPADI